MYEVMEAIQLLDGPVRGEEVADRLRASSLEPVVSHVEEEGGATDFVQVVVPGLRGRLAGGEAPTLGIVGRLGGIGARPGAVGLVSDGDGAVAALACALRMGARAQHGDLLEGDVVIATHICPEAPTEPHDPVSFMGSPVTMSTMNRLEVADTMDAVLVVDATKGNRVINWRGIAITPTVRQGWILPIAADLLDVFERVCGTPPRVLPLSMFDITPYGNGLYHVNSILQPAVATDAPVVGVAVTTETAVPGSATNASHPEDIALAVAFCLETAQRFGAGRLSFFDADQARLAVKRYGRMSVLQSDGLG